MREGILLKKDVGIGPVFKGAPSALDGSTGPRCQVSHNSKIVSSRKNNSFFIWDKNCHITIG